MKVDIDSDKVKSSLETGEGIETKTATYNGKVEDLRMKYREHEILRVRKILPDLLNGAGAL